MRLYAPLYEGDSMLRPDATIGAPVRSALRGPVDAPEFVRGNNQVEAANLTAFDLHSIEHAAHELRSIHIALILRNVAVSLGNGLKAAHTAVVNWLDRVEYQERDNFFAASANLAELEQRQRHFERTGHPYY